MPTLYNSETSASDPKKNHHVPVDPVRSKMRPLTAFAVKPDGVRFETQEAEETVEVFLRQHPIVNVPWIAIAIIMIFAPSFLFPVLLGVIKLPFTLPLGYLIIGTIFWYVMTFGFILANFLHWFFNIYIVTNERIVDIDFYYLLYKHFSEAELTKIQDISFTSSGLLATIFNYGNVLVETAGELPSIEFESIPHPQKVVEKIRLLTENAGKPV